MIGLWGEDDWRRLQGGVTSPAPLFNFFNDFNLFLRPLVADYIALLLLFLKIFLLQFFYIFGTLGSTRPSAVGSYR